MDIIDKVGSFSQASLIFLSFLQQTHCKDLQVELYELCHALKLCTDRDYYNGGIESEITGLVDSECDGELQTDGHSPTTPRSFVQDILPQVHLQLPLNAEEADAVREVAVELIRIADDLNHIIVTQAENLAKKMTESSSLQSWKNLLAQSVENLLKEVPGFHTEQMMMALSFSLVKAVCERVPCFLRGLYNVLMHYTSSNQAPVTHSTDT